ncbi:hypothetical protein FRC11_010650, partial [Ceratobasidium sp. 423]
FELTRARCTVIDPARYGAVHLKDGDGLLGAGVVSAGRDEKEETTPKEPVPEEIVVEQESEEESSRSPTPAPPIPPPAVPEPTPVPVPPQLVLTSSAPQPLEKEDPISLTQERSSALALLGGMFGEGEWGGRESVSGEEMEVMDAEGEGEVGYEVVPRASGEAERGAGVVDDEEEVEEEETGDVAEEQEDGTDEGEEQQEEEPPIKHSSLKDMFKPQEESTSFSLGLDIELDPDAESFLPSSISVPAPEPAPAPASIPTEKHAHTIQFTPDPKTPFFFPGGKNDIFRVIAEKGWEWPHPGTS